MKTRALGFLAIAAAATLTACGGNRFTPTALPDAQPLTGTSMVAAAAKPALNHTTAYGYVYSDPEGQPLAGLAVKLYPWIGCTKTSDKTRSCPRALPYDSFTSANGRFELANVPNGHYMLVIGDDSATDNVHPTIHDQVTFAGGVQKLSAPKLPREPQPAPFAVKVPAIERSGDYRVATLNPKYETPCFERFNADRVKRSLPAMVLDEWEVENSRAIVKYRMTIQFGHHLYPVKEISDGGLVTGGNTCDDLVDPSFEQKDGRVYSLDPRSLWYGGMYAPPGSPNLKAGSGEGWNLYGTDPRVIGAPAGKRWP